MCYLPFVVDTISLQKELNYVFFFLNTKSFNLLKSKAAPRLFPDRLSDRLFSNRPFPDLKQLPRPYTTFPTYTNCRDHCPAPFTYFVRKRGIYTLSP